MFPSPNSHAPTASEKLRVLVVDDEPTLRLGFAYALSNKTTVVETAATGHLALERMAKSAFDIMILDLRMPEIDGTGVIETLRNQGDNIPIILCSAVINPKAAIRAIRHGVVDFLLKPVKPTELREIVRRVTQPDASTLESALHAARNHHLTAAIQILETETETAHPPDEKLIGWLSVFHSIRETASHADHSLLENYLHTHLPLLAFNASLP
jgi:DNA-binding NtrC family response regulator